MKVRVLGSGAGGGFPQWNCSCENCRRVRGGDLAAHARTQSSIVVSNGEAQNQGHRDWVLINASPDIRAQLESFPELQPGRRRRDTAICGVVLVDAQLDHTTGLLTLREHDRPLEIWTTDRVREDLCGGFPVLEVLRKYCGVHWHPIDLGAAAFEIPGAEGLHFEAIAVEGEAPPYSPRRGHAQPGDNIGLQISDDRTGGTLVYIPGLGRWQPEFDARMKAADCVLVDGTLWTDDELAASGVGQKSGRDMGHLQQSGEGGLLAHLRAIEGPRKILIHINNTNPLLDPASPERRALEDAGVELAFDGLEIEL